MVERLRCAWHDRLRWSASLYASFSASAFYIDGLAGYANANEPLTRNIALSGSATRTASGRPIPIQFLGQVEAGYRVAMDGLAPSPVGDANPPACRRRRSTSQASPWGAGSLNLLVASRTTNSLRSTLGADLRGGDRAD